MKKAEATRHEAEGRARQAREIIQRQRLLIFLSLLIVTPLGLLSKSYQGFAQEWVHNYSGDILYEIFWCLLIFWFIPHRKNIIAIPLWIFSITCFLEILQLWQTPSLQLVRSHLIGRLLIGTTFAWWDFPHYVLGSLLGWVCLKTLAQTRKNPALVNSGMSLFVKLISFLDNSKRH